MDSLINKDTNMTNFECIIHVMKTGSETTFHRTLWAFLTHGLLTQEEFSEIMTECASWHFDAGIEFAQERNELED